MRIIKSISIIGDSILKGVVFDDIMGKYRSLKESAASLFGQTNKVEIKNHARFGCTTERALKVLPNVLETETSPDIVMLELGGNDCDYNWDAVCENPNIKHNPNVPFAKFKENLRTIIEKIIAAGKRPFIMTLPPIDADKYFNWITGGNQGRADNLLTFLGDKNFIYRTQERYATALETIASEYNLVRVNAREELLSIPKYSDYLCRDGIHLNERGQDFIKSVFDKTYKQHVSMA
ncbi:GDSL-type esterase/lipase family protein [Lachnospiraceae bacterium OttesenSCG-928-E19]|nr:GDSL-type esterase/lipase family protein [Lachnospiraceae bacterium OttesenSCG-928-E19]